MPVVLPLVAISEVGNRGWFTDARGLSCNRQVCRDEPSNDFGRIVF